MVLYLVLRPLEALIPVHAFTDKRARWNDFIYTVLQRVGVLPVLIFFTLDPALDALMGWLRLENVQPLNLETLFPDI